MLDVEQTLFAFEGLPTYLAKLTELRKYHGDIGFSLPESSKRHLLSYVLFPLQASWTFPARFLSASLTAPSLRRCKS
jgi:hypothetical protein